MKLVSAKIQRHRLNQVHASLVDLGITNHMVSTVKGFSEEGAHAEIHRGTAYEVDFMPMVKIEMVISDHNVEAALGAIRGTDPESDLSPYDVWVADVASGAEVGASVRIPGRRDLAVCSLAGDGQ